MEDKYVSSPYLEIVDGLALFQEQVSQVGDVLVDRLALHLEVRGGEDVGERALDSPHVVLQDLVVRRHALNHFVHRPVLRAQLADLFVLVLRATDGAE